MHTITQSTRPQYTHRIRSIGQTIPDSTPPSRLLELLERYANEHDPLIAVLPLSYREAVTDRLRTLLATTPAREPAQ